MPQGIRFEAVASIGSVSRLQDSTFPLLGIAWNFGGRWRLQTDYDFRFNTVGLKVANSFAFVALRTSQVNLSEAHAYDISAGLTWKFSRSRRARRINVPPG